MAGAKSWESGVEALWRQLGKREQVGDKAALELARTVRRELVDRLTALPAYSDGAGAEIAVDPSAAAAYLRAVEDVVRRLAEEALRRDSLEPTYQLADEGYKELLQQLAGLRSGSVGLGPVGIGSDLVRATEAWRTQAISAWAGAVGQTVASEMTRVVFGGQGRWDAVKAIRASLSDDGRHTAAAQRIERTALMSIFNAAASHRLSQAEGDVPGIQAEWSTAGQRSVCPQCQALEGKRKRPSGTFPGGVFAPPRHPNCRCRVIAWLPDWK